jgi:hypothetical protein
MPPGRFDTIDDVLAADAEARRRANLAIQKRKS